MIELSGDSGEYEFLTEAVQLSANVEGMCVEIGLRRGLGTKTIIDAVRQYCPNKTVISIDPYGSIPYIGREHMGACRLDYTNNMKAECMSAMWEYVLKNPVSYKYFDMTDDEFFDRFGDYVPVYELECGVESMYSMVHLDGVHTIAVVSKEVLWFKIVQKSYTSLNLDLKCKPVSV